MKHTVMTTLVLTSLAACASAPRDHRTETPPYPPHVPVYVTPQPTAVADQNPSLWATTPNALLSMRRAKEVGDLLTVVVEMNDQASLQNSLTRSRDTSDNFNLNALFGAPEWANGVLPGGASLSPGIDLDRSSDLSGRGAVNRAEKVTFTLASRVVAVEPNGNLVIQGTQESRVSSEVRYLMVSGVIRSQDITRTNTVSYEKIADARLSYVSRGEATDAITRGRIPKLLETYVPF